MAEENVEATETAEAAPEPEAGLLDNVETPNPDAVEAAEDDEIDHREPGGDGEKPEWLPDRFWDSDSGEADYEGLAKSQNALYKMMRNGKHKVPEGGEYDLRFVNERIAEDDELLGKFKEVAADRGLSQDDFEKIVGLVMETMPEDVGEPEQKFDREAEFAKLGPNGENIVNGVVKWAEGLVNNGAWTAEDFAEFKFMGGTAAGIRALNRLRQYYGEKTIPVDATPDTEAMPTEEELQAMVADPQYKKDPSFRRKVADQFVRKYGSDPNSPQIM